MVEVSIVIPLFNEEGNVLALHEEIVEVCKKNSYTYEVILVDDGSKDKTVELAKTLTPVKLIQLRKNFGQTAAMDGWNQGCKVSLHHYDGWR